MKNMEDYHYRNETIHTTVSAEKKPDMLPIKNLHLAQPEESDDTLQYARSHSIQNQQKHVNPLRFSWNLAQTWTLQRNFHQNLADSIYLPLRYI